MMKNKTFKIEWMSGAAKTGHMTPIDAPDLAGALWEATRMLRSTVKNSRAAVNQKLYGTGFTVEEEGAERQ